MNNPRISIIVPVYRTPISLLNRFLESAVGQTERNMEIIAVNDASPDECPAVLDALAAQDGRVTVIHRATNGRAGVARNDGLDRARGQFVLFADADDFIQPKMCETLMALADKHHADIVGCSFTMSSRDGQLLGQRRLPDRIYDLTVPRQKGRAYNNMTHALWDKIFRRETIAALRFESYEANIGEDTVFNVAALCRSRTMVTTAYAGYDYTVHPASATGRTDKGMAYLRTLSTSGQRIRQILDQEDGSRVGRKYADLAILKHFSTGCGWITEHSDSREKAEMWDYWRDHFIKGLLPQIEQRKFLATWCKLALACRTIVIVHRLTWVACRLADPMSMIDRWQRRIAPH